MAAHPLVPHFHTCRACARRHRFECRNARCDWRLLKDCSAGLVAAAVRKAIA